MDIQHGVKVIDKNGKMVGTVDRVVRDSWTGEIRKFTVSTSIAPDDLFYAPEDVLEATDNQVKLKVAFDKPSDVEIQFGADVLDRNGQLLGTVNHLVNDTYTGKVTSFRVDNGSEDGFFFSLEDVLSVTVTEVKLKVAREQINSKTR